MIEVITPNHHHTRTPFLPFAVPDLDESEIELVNEAIRSGWITTGPKALQFEAEFARAVAAKHAIAVNSCTAAMHLALESIGLQRGDEVITSPYTFAATAEVVRYFDAAPVFVDIEPATFNIDPALIEQAITPRTKAIIPVHVGGLPAEMEEILAIARKHGLAVIEDAAHAFPAMYNGAMVGNLGSNATCFSFYATKTITTAEGGMITTNDDALAERCRIMALHGISKDAWKRYTAEGSWYDEIVSAGYKYNMSDIAAAMGLAQLRKAERMLKRRKQIAESYTAAFSHILTLRAPVSSRGHAWHLYMLRLDFEDGRSESGGRRSERDRAWFIEELKRRNIGASVHFIPLHLYPYYKQTYGYNPLDFPIAYREYQREVSLPIYSKMTDEDVGDVVAAVQEITEQYSC
ncbi:MAG: UDP-4-amino-4,6-dideoxy-N-acetyl-beta-L-altrosamine transaminase [Ignavibacteria bacterium]